MRAVQTSRTGPPAPVLARSAHPQLAAAQALTVGAGRHLLRGASPAHGHDFLELAVVLGRDGVARVDGRGVAACARQRRPGPARSLARVRGLPGPCRGQRLREQRDGDALRGLVARRSRRRPRPVTAAGAPLVPGRRSGPSPGSRPGPRSSRRTRRPPSGWGLLLAVLGELAACGDPADDVVPVTRPDVVVEALRLLTGEPSRRWTLDELSRAVHVSPAHLARLFARSVGVPPMAYVDGVRAERAAALLTTTTLSVAAVGAAVGWGRSQLRQSPVPPPRRADAQRLPRALPTSP